MRQSATGKELPQYELSGKFGSEVNPDLLARFLSEVPLYHGPLELIAESRLPGVPDKKGDFECSGFLKSERGVMDVTFQGPDENGRCAPRIKVIVRRKLNSDSEQESSRFLPSDEKPPQRSVEAAPAEVAEEEKPLPSPEIESSQKKASAFDKDDLECVSWLLEELRMHFPDGVIPGKRAAHDKVGKSLTERFNTKIGSVSHILTAFFRNYCESNRQSFLLPAAESVRFQFNLAKHGLPDAKKLLAFFRHLRMLRHAGVVNKEDIYDARHAVLQARGRQHIEVFCGKLVAVGLLLPLDRPHMWRLLHMEVLRQRLFF
jgi:hypothetical protein